LQVNVVAAASTLQSKSIAGVDDRTGVDVAAGVGVSVPGASVAVAVNVGALGVGNSTWNATRSLRAVPEVMRPSTSAPDPVILNSPRSAVPVCRSVAM
jgi:hypothetical protein